MQGVEYHREVGDSRAQTMKLGTMNFETVGEKLRLVFTEFFYPTLVIGIFALLVIYKFILVLRARGDSRIRRLTAAVLPFLALIFALLPNNKANLSLLRMEGISVSFQFLGGALVAAVILELGRWLKRLDVEIAAVVYILFIALIDSYMLYSMIENSLGDLHFPLFGMVVGGGLYVIFRGTPMFTNKERRRSNNPDADPLFSGSRSDDHDGSSSISVLKRHKKGDVSESAYFYRREEEKASVAWKIGEKTLNLFRRPLTSTQKEVLTVVAKNKGPISRSELEALVNVSSGSIEAALIALQKKGMVNSTYDEEDFRYSATVTLEDLQ